jgi:hypothetical protein
VGPSDSGDPIGRTWLQTLAAGLLALGGGLTILYAGLVPIPPFSDVPVPLANQAIGLVSLAAAAGVFMRQAWGRALGILVAAAGVTLTVLLRISSQAPVSGPLDILVSLTLGVAPDVIILWVLLLRWPSRP